MKARIPGGAGGPNNFNAMLKQAQKMQEDMAVLKEDLDAREYVATAGGDAVKVIVSGKHEVKRVEIKPEIVDPDDVEMLEDFVTIAVNEAIRQAKEAEETEMSAITGNLNLPGVF